MRPVWSAALAAVILFAAVGPAAAQSSSRFSDWTAAIIAGDWRSTSGQPIQAFENARRDLTRAFLDAGFDPARTVSHALAPGAPANKPAALASVADIARANPAGCFLYFTSHGDPSGIVFGPAGRLSPLELDAWLDATCGARPTVVVVSACYSGVFIPPLRAPNRIVLTAARRDRNSFGCSEEATYPYFDGCVLEALPASADFIALAHRTRACVSRRETEEGLRPPSEPQMFIGAEMQLLAPTLRFAGR